MHARHLSTLSERYNFEMIKVMKVVNVIPISRGIRKETLTYFTSKKVSVGALVSVPLRKKTVHAVVLSVEDASRRKTDIKKASYGIKKISGVKSGIFLLPAFVRACEYAARYFAATGGEVLDALTSKSILDDCLSSSKIPLAAERINSQGPTRDPHKPSAHEKFLFQADSEDRIASYKSLVREEFSKKRSVFLCLPTIQNIERIAPSLKRGIEEFTYILHTGISKKELFRTWKKALKEPHPILIIGTGTFLFIPRADMGTLIVEEEHSIHYQVQRRPFIDIRTFTEFFARELDARLIWGDMFLRTETLYRKERGEFLEFTPLKWRSLSPAHQEIIDMKQYTTKAGEKHFTIISEPLKELIEGMREKSGRLFILVSRRGNYPLTVCGDCGKVVLCQKCSVPLVLHFKNLLGNTPHPQKSSSTETTKWTKNIFMCHKCGIQEESTDRCRKCTSWRLTPLGIGAERAEEEIQRVFPGIKILRIDKDVASRKGKAYDIAKTFYSSPGSVLIGTEMALAYLEKKVANVTVLSIDSLFYPCFLL